MIDRRILTRQERRLIERLSTPRKIQEFIDRRISYDFGEDGKIRSFRRVVREHKAHCLDGALFAAAALQQHGHPPLIVCMETREIDHNIAVYKQNERWGSVAQSRDSNLNGRNPVHRTIKSLVMSYYPYHWNSYSKKEDETDLAMRGYAVIDLRKIKRDWVTAEEDLAFIEDILWDAPYRFLFPRKDRSKFYKVGRKTGEVMFI